MRMCLAVPQPQGHLTRGPAVELQNPFICSQEGQASHDCSYLRNVCIGDRKTDSFIAGTPLWGNFGSKTSQDFVGLF